MLHSTSSRDDENMETSSKETKSQSLEDRVLESVDREDRVGETAVEGAPRTYEDDIVIWDDNDPEDPYNWTAGKRWRITMCLSGLTFVVTFASSVFSTALVPTEREFHISQEAATLGTSIYVLGWAIGPMIWGPFSELYGRTIPLFTGYALFTIFNIPVAVAQNTETVMLGRFFQGINSCAPLAVTGGALADIWGPVERGLAVMVFSVCCFIGPLLSPVVGGFIVMDDRLGWRWVEWITFLLAIFFGVLGLIGIPETYAATLLQRRAKKLKHQTKNWALHAKIDESKVNFKDILTRYLFRPIHMLVQEPILLLLSIYMSLVWGLLYLFLTSVPYSFQLERHWSPGVGALPFLSMTVGVFVGAILIILDVKLRFQPLFARSPELITPETRLPVMIAGSFILPIGLFWFAWTSNPKINPAPQIISGVVTGCGILMIFMQGLNYIVDVYRLNANSGIAANTMLRNVFGAAFPLFGMQLYDRLGVPWATSLLAFLAVAFIPGPLLFYVYGKRIREKSKFSFKQ